MEKCPMCGAKTEKGYIIIGGTNRRIGLEKVWIDKITASIKLAVHGGGAWPGYALTTVDAYRCQNCKAIFFFYEEGKQKE